MHRQRVLTLFLAVWFFIQAPLALVAQVPAALAPAVEEAFLQAEVVPWLR